MFDVDAMAAGQNRRMMAEALDIMVRFWTSDGALEHCGEFWTARRPADEPPTRFHLQPYQKLHPPIAITALSPGSSSPKVAGASGYLPVCIGPGDGYLRDKWRIVAEAADAAGRTAKRPDWRL
ncbi:MAG: LLM class flavin-dependent oxidoreductase [Porticoccaceae bacterium]